MRIDLFADGYHRHLTEVEIVRTIDLKHVKLCCQAYLLKKRFKEPGQLPVAEKPGMKDGALEFEDTMIQALDHFERREILRIISLSENGSSYTDLMDELGLRTGKLNYQLRQLEGLIEKNEQRRYVLTPLGKRAVSILGTIDQDIDSEFAKYLKVARLAQRSRLQPLARSLILGLIASLSVILVSYGLLAYVLLTEGGPFIMYILLPVLIALGIGFLAWLIRALRTVPEILGRLERRAHATAG